MVLKISIWTDGNSITQKKVSHKETDYCIYCKTYKSHYEGCKLLKENKNE